MCVRLCECVCVCVSRADECEVQSQCRCGTSAASGLPLQVVRREADRPDRQERLGESDCEAKCCDGTEIDVERTARDAAESGTRAVVATMVARCAARVLVLRVLSCVWLRMCALGRRLRLPYFGAGGVSIIYFYDPDPILDF